MDAVDRHLIDVLRADGRASYAELARSVGLSSSAVHERVAKLESAGVITGYRAVVEPSALGLGVTALISIIPGENGQDEQIAAALDRMVEVESCYAVAGDEAFILKVRVPTVDELHRSLGRLRNIDGVARTRTMVVLATRFEARPPPTTDEPTTDEPTTAEPPSGEPTTGEPGPDEQAPDGSASTRQAPFTDTATDT